MAEEDNKSTYTGWIVGGVSAVVALLIFGSANDLQTPPVSRGQPMAVPPPETTVVQVQEAPPAVPDYDAAENRPLEEPRDGYAGSEACRSCHSREFETWHHTYHRTMTQKPDTNSVMGNFEDGEFYNHVTGYGFKMTREENDFFITVMPPPNVDRSRHPKPIQTVHLKWPVALLTGSHHMQGYWVPQGKGRSISLAPVMYLKEDQQWISRSSAFLEPPGRRHIFEDGSWNRVCVRCHATGGLDQPHPQGGHDTRVAELGISCEACHGPAQHHVDWRETDRDATRQPQGSDRIVEPTMLAHARGSEVCGNCHGRTWPTGNAMPKYVPGDMLENGQVMLSYRPDVIKLLDKYVANHPVPDGVTTGKALLDSFLWSDGMARVSSSEYNGLIASPCHAGGEFSCFSCHRMHQAKSDSREPKEWANDLLEVGMNGDAACLQCHDGKGYDSAAHTHHAVGSSGSACYNCHMPHTSYGLLKAIRSHTISSPSVATTLETGRPNACNLCHLDKTLGWTADHLANWYEIDRPKLTAEQERVSAAVLDATKGDASLRALTAWSLGWEPAIAAAGGEWTIPYLALLMEDSYHAVRYIAGRSMRRRASYKDLPFDFLGDPTERKKVVGTLMQKWVMNRKQGGEPEARPELLIRRDGDVDGPALKKLLAKRDNRRIGLNE